MSRRRSSRSAGGLVVTLVVGVLAVTAVLLAIFALRSPTTPDAGEVPGPIPTWGGGSSSSGPKSPSPTPSSTGEASTATPQFLSMYDGSLGIRATIGSCTGTPSVVQRTADGGATWTAVSFAGIDVRQVLGLDFVSDSQITVIAAAADCVPTVVTSFTAGEFWQAYPEQIDTAVFVQPTDPTKIRNAGTDLVAPCAVRELRPVGQAIAVLCSDGSMQVRSSGASWKPVGTGGILALAPSGTSTVLAAASDRSCAGVLIRSVDVGSGATTDLSCLVAGSADATLDELSGSAFYWSSTEFLTSKNGGAAWTPVG